jgi:hypothetical protein
MSCSIYLNHSFLFVYIQQWYMVQLKKSCFTLYTNHNSTLDCIQNWRNEGLLCSWGDLNQFPCSSFWNLLPALPPTPNLHSKAVNHWVACGNPWLGGGEVLKSANARPCRAWLWWCRWGGSRTWELLFTITDTGRVHHWTPLLSVRTKHHNCDQNHTIDTGT